MVCAKNYETMSTFVEVMQKKNCGLFFPDTLYMNVLLLSLRLLHLIYVLYSDTTKYYKLTTIPVLLFHHLRYGFSR